ncbi:MAG: glycosyltransferase family 2 protein [Pedobacter sp.]|uniref:glycosyltransferase family 2 protein n=1 Tax=Pedobacter sp. TaxID=1411316 RepID=UPI00356505FE
MRPIQPITAPTRKEQFTLRLMITLGLISMGFFLNTMLFDSLKGYPPLYWMLIVTFAFICLKTLHEWCHYLWITVPDTPVPTRTYTVDIFTTFCAGEPYEMIEETLAAIQAITYPHKTYLCDEANDPYLKKLCEKLGVNHITRKQKINAKAGNINNALGQSNGEICVILDPDHVPFPDFLDPIVSHFDNPKIGFVQVVQAYKNNDENLIAKGAAQQTYQFYGPIMMTMNKYGTVLAIGANCTFRRTALESIGGHAAGLAEDMHTAMQLHSKGWESIYVPQILARGLAPSTLSAYYKQQLKWSRGVFDLLVNVYPKLYKGFTWKQKIHYAVIPVHYLSGIFYLLNFLIPIISLFFNVSPIQLNITDFGIAVLPFIVSTLMIRHFVQWWVMEDEERGFHVVGGLLIIGAWWIFILGFVYTLIGKKVPYVPTPKDNNEANNWPLNIPNITILVLSLTAIIYGLTFDWNPYNLIMAGFAGLNSLILIFNIVASRQQQFKLLKERYPFANGLITWIKKIKVNFWFMRRRLYTSIRSTTLIITVIMCCVVLYFAKVSGGNASIQPKVLDHKSKMFLTGIFSPVDFNGISSVHKAKQEQQLYNNHFNLISLYIPWGEQAQCYLPQKTIDSIYSNGSVPMITWEPWQNLFKENSQLKKDEKVFKKITEGKYNTYLKKFCEQIKAMNRPVFIRFAHEMDNPAYPWSQTGNNTSDEFKAAWKFLHSFFLNEQVYQVIWVWNPWKHETLDAYFPGNQYVDWIGVTNLNYGPAYSGKWTSMSDIYAPYHQNKIFRSGLPVMLAEMGSNLSAGKQGEWFRLAFETKHKFKEIKAFVLFNSGFDKNVPDGGSELLINWTIQHPDTLKNLLNKYRQNNMESVMSNTPQFLSSYSNQQNPNPKSSENIPFLSGIRGINYNRAQDWKKNYETITMREILADFNDMKRIGINTIKRYGPDIYDRNLLRAAKMNDFNILYAYWISDEINFFKDKEQLEILKTKILNSVRYLKEEQNVIAWNIGNAVFQKLDIYYYKPELLYQQDAYLAWLRNLVLSIKEIDPKRPVTVDVELSNNTAQTIDRIKRLIPEIDAYGIVVNQNTSSFKVAEDITVPYFYSDIEVPTYNKLQDNKAGSFISNFYDEQKIDQVTDNGIKDYKGREKLSFSQLFHLWNHGPAPAKPPHIKILKPALGTFKGSKLEYHALIKTGQNWNIAIEGQNNMKFEWNLVKVDRFEKPISMEKLSNGTKITLSIPENPSDYRLYLYVSKGKQVLNIVKSKLNTPFIVKVN